ncbi:MAG: hypothetical protein ACLUPF_05615 [Dorea sp.]
MLAIGIPWEIHAENAAVTFGSNYYTATDNETFPIGVYLNGDSRIGTYEVKISYDSRRLEYTGGGDSEENGVITLSGTGVSAGQIHVKVPDTKRWNGRYKNRECSDPHCRRECRRV